MSAHRRPTPRAVLAAGACALALSGLGPDALAQEPAAPPAAPAAAAPTQAPPGAQVALSPGQAALVLQTLRDAPGEGLISPSFSAAELQQLADAAASGGSQAPLISALLSYARAVHSGQLPESAFEDDWGMKPVAYNPAPGLAAAVAADQLKPWLDGLPPPYTGYETLRKGLAAYRDIAGHGGWSPIAPGPELKLGSTGPRVRELRARLAAEDPAVHADGPAAFDQELAQGVARAQKRFGLKDDGVVNAATLQALNTPVQARIDQIVANMERWRWLPPELPTDRIQVNIAAAILTVFHADTPTLSMRAVTGRPGDETPMLQSKIESIVLNPPWNVPSTIATKELWPKEKAHPGYLKAHDFVVVHTDDGGTRLQQRAGDQSALGRIKFDFPNKYAVYLHDTPTHGTFDRYSRLASHGCVRLQRPLDLANAVMEGDATWTPETIQSTIDSGKTVRAQLPHPISVFLFYWTAYVAPDGQVNFRDDPYGWDKLLVQKLRGADADAS